jgi:hypothetical protein
MNLRYKLECFSLASLSRLILCLRVLPGAYPTSVSPERDLHSVRFWPYQQTLEYAEKLASEKTLAYCGRKKSLITLGPGRCDTRKPLSHPTWFQGYKSFLLRH